MAVPEFAIIGGGLVGSALAWGLASAGRRVLVLDEGDDAFRASRGNFGLVWVQSKGDGMPEYAAWSRKSAGLWPELARRIREETGIDVGLRQPGGIELCLDEAEYRARELMIRRMHNQPGAGDNDTRMIDAGEVRRLVPQVGPAVVGASFCPHDGHVGPLPLLHGLHRANCRLGVDYRPDSRVESVAPDGEGFALRTASGHYRADRVVLAAGLGNGRLAPGVGLNVPTAPERGHVLVTERLAPLFDYPVGRVRQTAEGTVMFGASAEQVGLDTGFNMDVAAAIAARAVRAFPALGRARIARAWSALRVMSPDGFPIYRQSQRCPGAFVVTCHSGVTLAAAHALALAPQLLEDGFNTAFAAFSPDRFDVPAAA